MLRGVRETIETRVRIEKYNEKAQGNYPLRLIYYL